MPLKGKVTSRSAKKGKTLRKSTCTVTYDSESSGQDEPSVQDALRGITTMMASMNTRIEAMEGGNRKKRRVAFRDPADAPTSSADEAVPEAASSRSAAPHRVEEGESAAMRTTASTSRRTRVPPPPPGRPVDVSNIFTHDHELPLPAAAAAVFPPLPDMSETVRARVAQCPADPLLPLRGRG